MVKRIHNTDTVSAKRRLRFLLSLLLTTAIAAGLAHLLSDHYARWHYLNKLFQEDPESSAIGAAWVGMYADESDVMDALRDRLREADDETFRQVVSHLKTQGIWTSSIGEMYLRDLQIRLPIAEPEWKRQIAFLLGRLAWDDDPLGEHRRTFDLVNQLFADETPNVRYNALVAAMAMSEQNHEGQSQLLAQARKDENPTILRHAWMFTGLHERSLPEEEWPTIEMIKSMPSSVAEAIIWAESKLRQDDLPLALSLAVDPDAAIPLRAMAVYALKDQPGESARTILRRLVEASPAEAEHPESMIWQRAMLSIPADDAALSNYIARVAALERVPWDSPIFAAARYRYGQGLLAAELDSGGEQTDQSAGQYLNAERASLSMLAALDGAEQLIAGVKLNPEDRYGDLLRLKLIARQLDPKLSDLLPALSAVSRDPVDYTFRSGYAARRDLAGLVAWERIDPVALRELVRGIDSPTESIKLRDPRPLDVEATIPVMLRNYAQYGLIRSVEDQQRASASILAGMCEVNPEILQHWLPIEREWVVRQHMQLGLMMLGENNAYRPTARALLSHPEFPRSTALLALMWIGDHQALDDLFNPFGSPPVNLDIYFRTFGYWWVMDHFLPEPLKEYSYWGDRDLRVFQLELMINGYLLWRDRLSYESESRRFTLIDH